MITADNTLWLAEMSGVYIMPSFGPYLDFYVRSCRGDCYWATGSGKLTSDLHPDNSAVCGHAYRSFDFITTWLVLQSLVEKPFESGAPRCS